MFVELPPFERYRQDYLGDESFRQLQQFMLSNPEAGDVIEGTGGLRKLRHADARQRQARWAAGDLLLVAGGTAVLVVHPVRQR